MTTSEPTPPESLFHFDEGYDSFDDLVRENGVDTWSARDLMEAMEYSSWGSFQEVLGRAQKAVINSGHDVTAHFAKELDDDGQEDQRLTKFACYMVAMNGSPTKPCVALAQAYFATMVEAIQRFVDGTEDVERLLIRGEVVQENKGLVGAAKAHGASTGLDFAMFQDAGYMGLYNLSCKQLARHKGLQGTDAKRVMDFMGSRELAANLFRITETKAKIEAGGVDGNRALQDAHRSVGRQVREAMQANTGERPEDLPKATDMRKIRSDFKRTGNKLVPKRKPRELE